MIYGILIADFLMAGIFAWRFGTVPQEIPLFYSRAWGEDQLVDFWFILLLPILMHVFIVLNGYVYQRYFLPDSFIHRIINTLNWTLLVLFTYVFVRILLFIT